MNHENYNECDDTLVIFKAIVYSVLHIKFRKHLKHKKCFEMIAHIVENDSFK